MKELEFEDYYEYLEKSSKYKRMEIHNQYCDENSYSMQVSSNDEEYLKMSFNGNLMDFVRMINHSEYNLSDEFVYMDDDGRLISDDRINALIEFHDIANWMQRTDYNIEES